MKLQKLLLCALATSMLFLTGACSKEEKIMALSHGDVCPEDSSNETYTCKYASSDYNFIHGTTANFAIDENQELVDYSSPTIYAGKTIEPYTEGDAIGTTWWTFSNGDVTKMNYPVTSSFSRSFKWLISNFTDIIDHETWVEIIRYENIYTDFPDGSSRNIRTAQDKIVVYKPKDQWPKAGNISAKPSAFPVEREVVIKALFSTDDFTDMCPANTGYTVYLCYYSDTKYINIHGQTADFKTTAPLGYYNDAEFPTVSDPYDWSIVYTENKYTVTIDGVVFTESATLGIGDNIVNDTYLIFEIPGDNAGRTTWSREPRKYLLIKEPIN